MRSGSPAAEAAGPARRVARLAVLTILIGAAGCYGFTGGGGFPDHIETLYIAPFDNETAQFELEQQLFSMLVDRLPGQLGIRLAGESTADAILRGRITRYGDAAQNVRASDSQFDRPEVLAHEIQVGIAAELIDVRQNIILWETSGLAGRGVYRPESESDQIAQTEAIENLVDQILDAAQSQW